MFHNNRYKYYNTYDNDFALDTLLPPRPNKAVEQLLHAEPVGDDDRPDHLQHKIHPFNHQHFRASSRTTQLNNLPDHLTETWATR